MEIKKRPTALILFVGYLLWDLVIKPIWTLNVERLAERQHLDRTLFDGSALMGWAHWLITYIPSSFGLGFVTGGLIFAYWDMILSVFKKPNVSEDKVEPATGIRAWVGTISFAFNPTSYQRDGCATLYITLINVGTVPFRIGSVRGQPLISFDPGNGRRKTVALPTPSISVDVTESGPMEFAFYGPLFLKQPIPSEVAKAFPETFSWKPWPSLDLTELKIELLGNDGSSKTLTLWDGVMLKGGDYAVSSDQYSLVKAKDEVPSSQ